MVLRYTDGPTLTGPAAGLFKAAADLTAESGRLQAQGPESLLAGLAQGAKSFAGERQQKQARSDRLSQQAFENARQTGQDSLNAQYKQFEMDHGSASLLLENADRYQKAAFEAGMNGDQQGYESNMKASVESRTAAQTPLSRIRQGQASGFELGPDGRAKPQAHIDHG